VVIEKRKFILMPIAEESVLAALRQVRDPELMVNIVDLGLIYGVGVDEVEGKSNVHVIMTMTTPACPFGPELIRQVKEVLAGMEGVGTVEVQLTLTPPWTPDRMTEEARDELGMF
jgi:metal-sulfur cluster biosynthetic enzyme